MSQETSPPIGALALTSLAGAAVGAIVVALTTPKSGKEVREDLKNLGSRIRQRTKELVDMNEVEA